MLLLLVVVVDAAVDDDDDVDADVVDPVDDDMAAVVAPNTALDSGFSQRVRPC